jgi:resuscitation-promoting factor RpfB
MSGSSPSGRIFLVLAGGAIVLWSGTENISLIKMLQSLIGGNKSQPGTSNEPVTSTSTASAASGGGTQGSTAPGMPLAAYIRSNQATAQLIAMTYGWGPGPQWTALNNLVTNLSGWNNLAQNSASGAYGIFQLPASAWAATGYTQTSDPATQIEAGLAYIAQQYGNPQVALAFYQAHGYY